MEVKKSEKADLEPKKIYFFEIGLIIAIFAMVGAFSWSQDKKVLQDAFVDDGPIIEQEIVEVTVQEDKRPPAPVKTQAVTISDIIEIVKNDTKIEQDMTIFDLDMSQDIAVDVSKFGGTYTGEQGIEDEETPVVLAEKMPSFEGGDQNTFSRWVQSTLKYPPIALDNGVEGKVRVQFVVEKDGSVSHVTVVRGVDKELDAAAVKKIESSPKWTPGMNSGRSVRVYINMTVSFQITPND